MVTASLLLAALGAMLALAWHYGSITAGLFYGAAAVMVAVVVAIAPWALEENRAGGCGGR